ncbi:MULTISPECIES: tape-measure protein [unclassified Streptomyces]|uniref:tape-measure protein n=1 Tax=unclassified Streptomyces TaxID=2593676 RepID=UPI003700FB19
MSAAAMPLNPLAGSAAAFSGLTSAAAQAAGAVLRVKQAVDRAASGADRLRTAARTAATPVRAFAGGATAAAGAAAKLGRSRAGTGVRSFGGKAARARSSAAKLGTGAGGLLALLLPLLPVAGLLSGLMSSFGAAMTIAAIAMTAVNVAMRANPLGFVIGLIVPIAAYLIELALTSETGQRIIRQVFQQALKGFQSVWNFLQPVLKLIGTAIGTYVKAWLTVFRTALKVVGAAVGGISGIGSAVRSATTALRSIASRTIGGVKSAVQPVVRWITDKIPGFFRTAKDAVSKALKGIGDLVKGGLSAVLGVVKGPVNGLIAFANWIIDGLNKLSFKIPLTGKKFGVSLDKLPMLAEGGIVAPPEAGEYRIDTLGRLENRRVPALTEAPPPPHRVREFREEPGAGPRAAAEDLYFLLTAHAGAGSAHPVLT